MPKNKQSGLIVSVKTRNIGFIKKHIRNSEEGAIQKEEIKEGGYSVLVNYQSLPSNIFSLAPPPPPIIFLYKI